MELLSNKHGLHCLLGKCRHGLIPLDGVSNGMTQTKLHHESKQETNQEKKSRETCFQGLISPSKGNVFLT